VEEEEREVVTHGHHRILHYRGEEEEEEEEGPMIYRGKEEDIVRVLVSTSLYGLVVTSTLTKVMSADSNTI